MVIGPERYHPFAPVSPSETLIDTEGGTESTLQVVLDMKLVSPKDETAQ
jgi:hypothetical protein